MMRMLKKIVYAMALAALGTVAAAAFFLFVLRPARRAASPERFEATPARLERGAYLANHQLACFECHAAKRDWSRWGAPIVEGPGAGGPCLDRAAGFPGRLCMANITPDVETGIGGWTDGEILRAIREGVRRDGSALFAMMPFDAYRQLSEEDGRSLVVYLRSLPPVRVAVPSRELDFPLNLVVRLMPKPLDGAVPEPDRANRTAYEDYLAGTAGCLGCHTPGGADHRPDLTRPYAGGQEFKGPGYHVRSANLTPHPTGWAGRDAESFVALFRASGSQDAAPLAPGASNTVMPWAAYRGLTDDDLKALHAHLARQAPIENVVEKFPGRAAAPGAGG